MATEKLPFVTLDVFTTKRFRGNQVAVVQVGEEQLSTAHMQMIAQEFNFSETVFLRQGSDGALSVNIFTPVNEMDFAGHPIIGTAHAIFGRLLPDIDIGEINPYEITVVTKAGPVVVKHEPEQGIVTAEVPHNVHIHSKLTTRQELTKTQPELVKQASQMETGYPAVSIVRGVTYTLVDFTNQADLFATVAAGPSQATELDEGWGPSFTGTMYYRASSPRSEDGVTVQDLRVRMIAIDLEDPACGSGSSSLAAYLALQKGSAHEKYRFYIDQGSEIGRDSNIIVEVTMDHTGKKVSSIFLSGSAALVTEGALLLPE